MDREQLDRIASAQWPPLKDVFFWAPEILDARMWAEARDPRTLVLYQLYKECETFRHCLVTGTDWPSPPGGKYPGNYHQDALGLMDLVENKEAWQYSLCAHFRELF